MNNLAFATVLLAAFFSPSIYAADSTFPWELLEVSANLNFPKGKNLVAQGYPTFQRKNSTFFTSVLDPSFNLTSSKVKENGRLVSMDVAPEVIDESIMDQSTVVFLQDEKTKDLYTGHVAYARPSNSSGENEIEWDTFRTETIIKSMKLSLLAAFTPSDYGLPISVVPVPPLDSLQGTDKMKGRAITQKGKDKDKKAKGKPTKKPDAKKKAKADEIETPEDPESEKLIPAKPKLVTKTKPKPIFAKKQKNTPKPKDSSKEKGSPKSKGKKGRTMGEFQGDTSKTVTCVGKPGDDETFYYVPGLGCDAYYCCSSGRPHIEYCHPGKRFVDSMQACLSLPDQDNFDNKTCDVKNWEGRGMKKSFLTILCAPSYQISSSEEPGRRRRRDVSKLPKLTTPETFPMTGLVDCPWKGKELDQFPSPAVFYLHVLRVQCQPSIKQSLEQLISSSIITMNDSTNPTLFRVNLEAPIFSQNVLNPKEKERFLSALFMVAFSQAFTQQWQSGNEVEEEGQGILAKERLEGLPNAVVTLSYMVVRLMTLTKVEQLEKHETKVFLAIASMLNDWERRGLLQGEQLKRHCAEKSDHSICSEYMRCNRKALKHLQTLRDLLTAA